VLLVEKTNARLPNVVKFSVRTSPYKRPARTVFSLSLSLSYSLLLSLSLSLSLSAGMQALMDAVEAMRKTNKWAPPPGVDIEIDIDEIKRNAEAAVKKRSVGAKSENSGLGSRSNSASRIYGQGSKGSVANNNRGGSVTARGSAPPRPPKGKGPPQVISRLSTSCCANVLLSVVLTLIILLAGSAQREGESAGTRAWVWGWARIVA
jgi:hypothetical protein